MMTVLFSNLSDRLDSSAPYTSTMSTKSTVFVGLYRLLNRAPTVSTSTDLMKMANIAQHRSSSLFLSSLCLRRFGKYLVIHEAGECIGNAISSKTMYLHSTSIQKSSDVVSQVLFLPPLSHHRFTPNAEHCSAYMRVICQFLMSVDRMYVRIDPNDGDGVVWGLNSKNDKQ